MFDAHEIHPNLWQGSKPSEGRGLARLRFDCLVLCAKEAQPDSSAYPGVEVIHAPFEDGYLTTEALITAKTAASRVSNRLKDGKKVLVTCKAGVNRSALVVGLALHMAYGYDGRSIVDLIRSRRKLAWDKALSNPHFAGELQSLKGKPYRPDCTCMGLGEPCVECLLIQADLDG
jgi:hypothetical protein